MKPGERYLDGNAWRVTAHPLYVHMKEPMPANSEQKDTSRGGL